MHRLVTSVRLRSAAEADRKVTWLELFFDLIFVAAVAQVAEPLRHDYSVGALVRLTPLLALIWWAWAGHTFFSTRFDAADGIQRGLTFLQIFAVAVMAANAKDALDSRSSAGFAAAYAAVRLVLVGQYLRVRHLADARVLAQRHIAGHGSAALVWLFSALVPAPLRFWMWAIAFAIDLGTPWTAVPHSVKAPPDAAHLPERFSLFTLILLGEAVVAVMQGMESQDEWPLAAALAAFLGMGVPFLICWWYFHRALDAGERTVRNHRDAIRFHVWSYAHFPLYLGIVVLGVGVQRIVTAASHYAVSGSERSIVVGAAVTIAISMKAISSTAGQTAHRNVGHSAHIATARV
jgi:low temperature requirement protein LtrA